MQRSFSRDVKIREAKSKGEKKRYTHLNAEFQSIARRDKKAFLSDQCKEIEENNRMGKTRDLFKKIRDTKGTFHAKMGSIKDRYGMDLTEAEDIKKTWQEYTALTYSFSYLEPVCCSMSSSNCRFLTYFLTLRFLKRQVRWSGIPISFRIFHSLFFFQPSVSHDVLCK